MKFTLQKSSKGGKFHVYGAFSKRAGGGKLYIPAKEGVEPAESINVTVPKS